MTNETNNVGMMTFRLPRVSARKPHKGLDVMIPTKAIALSNPLPFVVRFKSHSAIGKMTIKISQDGILNRELGGVKFSQTAGL